MSCFDLYFYSSLFASSRFACIQARARLIRRAHVVGADPRPGLGCRLSTHRTVRERVAHRHPALHADTALRL